MDEHNSVYICVYLYIYIYKGHSKNFKLHPDFRFGIHISPLYGPHCLHWN